MELNYIYIGMSINRYRQAQNMTIDSLAEKSGITPQYCSQIMNGRAQLSLKCLVNICNALNVTPNDLLAENITSEKVEVHLLKSVEHVFSDAAPSEIGHMLAISSAIKQSLRIANDNPNPK